MICAYLLHWYSLAESNSPPSNFDILQQIQVLSWRGVRILRKEQDGRLQGCDHTLSEAVCGLLCQHGEIQLSVLMMIKLTCFISLFRLVKAYNITQLRCTLRVL